MPRSLRSLHPKEAVAQKAATPTLRSRKQQFVHDEIWGAAIDLFATRGFDATTVDDIARAAGVSRRSFFRYFSSKNDLMVQAIRTYGITLAEAVEQCPGEPSAYDVLRYTVLVVAQQIAAHPRTRTIMEITAKSPAAREAQLSGFGELQDQLAQAFASRFKPSRRSDLSPQVFAALTQTLVDTTIHSWFYGDQPDISVTVKRVFTTVDHLLCKSSAR